MLKLDIAMSCLFQFYTHRKHRYYLLLTSLIMLTEEYKRQDFENDLKTHMRMKDLLVYKNLIETINNSKWENIKSRGRRYFFLIFCWNVFVSLQTSHFKVFFTAPPNYIVVQLIFIYPLYLLRKIKHLLHASPVIGSDNPRKKTGKFLSYSNSDSWK